MSKRTVSTRHESTHVFGPPKSETVRKLLNSTYGKSLDSSVAEIYATFAHTAVVSLEDWRDKRLTAEEVCETLLAAAIARNLARPNLKKLTDEQLDDLLTKVQVRSFTKSPTNSPKEKP